MWPRLALVLGLVLGVAGMAVAGSAGAAPLQGGSPPAAPATPAMTVYACPNGETVRARYPDTSTAVVDYRGERHTLKAAPSGSGARYVGEGLQWWTRGVTVGMISVLAPGADYAEPGPECVAPAP